jgi:hypothetical protein
MATNPRSTFRERPDCTLVRSDRKKTARSTRPLMGRIISTVVELAVLAVVFRYLPPGPRNAQANTGSISVDASPGDLQLGSLLMSHAPADEALYLDGVVKNTGTLNVTGATVEVDFHDANGQIAGSLQKPIAGMTHGGTDLVRNEFKRNPLPPNEMRFFRVAIEKVPSAWNHELPELKVVEVKAR